MNHCTRNLQQIPSSPMETAERHHIELQAKSCQPSSQRCYLHFTCLGLVWVPFSFIADLDQNGRGVCLSRFTWGIDRQYQIVVGINSE